jgi:tetratricopeptide (TPR) repeat protein
MIPVQAAIRRCRRDLAIGAAIRALLLGAIFALTVVGTALNITSGAMFVGIGAIWVVWMSLNVRSMRASRLAASSPSLIAAGDFESAEEQIEQAIRSFSLFRAVKLMALHYLAVLRHAQRRFDEAAAAAQAVLSHRLGAAASLSVRARLILADALLAMGDLAGAYEAIRVLYSQRLSLTEAVNLAAVQAEYQARIGDWTGLLSGIARKVELSELLPTQTSVKLQASLALAAGKLGRTDWCDWLRQRVELLVDAAELTAERPWLAALWSA